MASALYQVVFVVGLLVFSTLNILLLEWAEHTISRGSDRYSQPRPYQHPYVQGVAMYIGQFLCFFVYWLFYFIRPSSAEANWVPVAKWFLFLPPTLIGMIGTTITYIGLNLTYPQSYQMLRGVVVVFTGLLSVAFLGRSVRFHMWVGIATLTVGLIGIGLSDALIIGVDTDANGVVSGDLLIILAQIILSSQFVYEEKYLKKHNVSASLAVGLEGLFGGVILGALLVPMYDIPASKPFSLNPGHLEDVWDALTQMKNNWHIIFATVGLVVCSAFSGYCGVRVTKELSATTRQVVCSGTTLFVWIVALGLKWQPFHAWPFVVQFVGFAMLVIGMMIYQDFVFRPFLVRHHCLKKLRQTGAGDDTSSEMTNSSNEDDDRERLIIGRE